VALVILSGLPGVGKTTIARELAAALTAVHVRIDSIEQALRDAGLTVEEEGYRVGTPSPKTICGSAESSSRIASTRGRSQGAPGTPSLIAPPPAQSAWNSFARTSVNTNGESSHDYPTSPITGYRHGRR
jgi:DNA polymerase III delta prime subunit